MWLIGQGDCHGNLLTMSIHKKRSFNRIIKSINFYGKNDSVYKIFLPFPININVHACDVRLGTINLNDLMFQMYIRFRRFILWKN